MAPQNAAASTKNTPYSIKATDMTDEMQAEVIEVATEAVKLHHQVRSFGSFGLFGFSFSE
jgi:ribosomal protein L9